jgi:hypothetical protein
MQVSPMHMVRAREATFFSRENAQKWGAAFTAPHITCNCSNSGILKMVSEPLRFYFFSDCLTVFFTHINCRFLYTEQLLVFLLVVGVALLHEWMFSPKLICCTFPLSCIVFALSAKMLDRFRSLYVCRMSTGLVNHLL